MWEYTLDKGWRSIGDILNEISPLADFSKQIDDAGFGLSPVSKLGLSDTDFYAEIYESDSHKKYKYMVVVEVGSVIKSIFVPDFSDLVEFLSKISPISQAALMRLEIEDKLARE